MRVSHFLYNVTRGYYSPDSPVVYFGRQNQ